MLYSTMIVFEPVHMAAVLSSGTYISRTQLWFLLTQRNRFSFLRKSNKNGNSTKKQICCMLRTLKKNPAIFCYTRQVTSSKSFANRKNLMGGIKLILVQLSSETDWNTAHLVKTSDLASVSTHSEKQVKKNILCEQWLRYRSTQE